MKFLRNFLGLSLLIFSNLILLNAVDTQNTVTTTTTTTTDGLTYKIMKDTSDSKMKVSLVLSGTEYTAENYCHIMKPNTAEAAYEEINSCPGTDTSSANDKCARKCLEAGNNIEFGKFSPRTKYIVVFTDNTAANAVGKVTTGGAVFGLELPLLVNPQVTITIQADSKLKLNTKTCNPVDCPVYYKGVKYADGTKVSDCDTSIDNQVEFDLMIPHYEMKCETYPSFFYKLQNPHTLFNIDVYKPQYYVTYKSTEKTKYSLKFTNKFSYEMCRFGIKDVATTITATSTNEYTSNCGGTNKDCYAPCNNVVLTLSPSKPIVDVLIQTRYTPLQKVNNNYVGYKQQKFVAADTTDGLLPAITHDSVTINVQLFKPTAEPKFDTCTVTYYAADKPKPTTTRETPKCGTTSDSSATCVTTCAAALKITSLASGKPYILEITAPTPAAGGVPASFKEHIFFRTEKKTDSTFPEIRSTLTETKVLINHPAANAAATSYVKADDTCAYYISPRGKDVYVCAFCLGSYPCRGYCKEPQTILGLTPGTDYDLKVVTDKDHGFKTYEITTPPATIALTKENIDKGFKVIGTLAPENAATLCNYKVKVEQGSTYVTIHECPATPPPAPVVAAAASSSIVSKLSQMFIARASANPGPSTQAAATSTGSTTQTTTTNDAPSTQTGTNNAATTTTSTNTATATAPTTCTEAPFCANIQFTTGYDRSKKYQVSVTTKFGLSTEVTIDIPANPLPVSEAAEKKVTVNIERDGNKLKVTTTLPTGVTEKTCGWELRNSTSTEKPLLKSCNGANDNGCASFPSCAEFEIVNVEDIADYHLTVYVSDDSTIIGTGEIKKGETYDTSKSISKNTIIMAAAGAGIVVILVAVVIVVMKKRN